jgi:hypothetical protein
MLESLSRKERLALAAGASLAASHCRARYSSIGHPQTSYSKQQTSPTQVTASEALALVVSAWAFANKIVNINENTARRSGFH